MRRSKARDRAAEETKRHEATRKRLADAKRFRQEEAERQEELRMKEQDAWDRAAQRRRDRVHAEGGGPPPPPPPTRPDSGRAAKGGAGGAMTMRGWLGAARLVRARPPVTGSRHQEPPLTTGALGGQDSYHAAFVDLGVEDAADFKDVTDDDLDAIGLKKIEKNRFRKALIYAE